MPRLRCGAGALPAQAAHPRTSNAQHLAIPPCVQPRCPGHPYRHFQNVNNQRGDELRRERVSLSGRPRTKHRGDGNTGHEQPQSRRSCLLKNSSSCATMSLRPRPPPTELRIPPFAPGAQRPWPTPRRLATGEAIGPMLKPTADDMHDDTRPGIRPSEGHFNRHPQRIQGLLFVRAVDAVDHHSADVLRGITTPASHQSTTQQGMN